MPDLIPFLFGDHPVRIHLDDDDQPWWVAKDVCAVLGLQNISNAVGRLQAGEKGVRQADNLLIINESGLYRLIFRSDKPDARRFQDWVFNDVLPAIRKTGKYEVTPASERYPELRAIVELVEATAEARVIAEDAKAEAARARQAALVAETKADLALQDAHRMTLEDFILKNGLLRQFPAAQWPTHTAWLKTFCQGWGLSIQKVPVYGKAWDHENGYPLSALGAWLRQATTQPRQGQLTVLTKEPPHGA
jgi:prophage antirepressor-like protein